MAGILHYVAAVRPLYLALWCVLAAISGGLVVLMRSRWGRKNPFYRCAVASLLVHVLLVGLTMTVRLVVGDGGAGAGPPIYVKLVDDVQREGPIELAAPPALLVEEEAAASAKPASDVVADTAEAEPLESPPLLAPPEPVAEEKIVMEDAAEPEPVTPIESGPEMVAPTNSGEATAVVTEVASNVPPATSPYAHRTAPIDSSTRSGTAAASRRKRRWPRRCGGLRRRNRRTAGGTPAASVRGSSERCSDKIAAARERTRIAGYGAGAVGVYGGRTLAYRGRLSADRRQGP